MTCQHNDHERGSPKGLTVAEVQNFARALVRRYIAGLDTNAKDCLLQLHGHALSELATAWDQYHSEHPDDGHRLHFAAASLERVLARAAIYRDGRPEKRSP